MMMIARNSIFLFLSVCAIVQLTLNLLTTKKFCYQEPSIIAVAAARSIEPSSSLLSYYLVPENPDPAPLKKIRAIIPSSDNNTKNDPLRSCNVTAQVRIIILEEERDIPKTKTKTKTNVRWILQTMDSHGNDKTVGGDEFYIVYHHHHHHHDLKEDEKPDVDVNGGGMPHPTAVANIQDQMDGTYTLDFTTTPLSSYFDTLNGHGGGGGNLTIHFVYTCGIGQMAPPTKDDWPNGGFSQTVYSLALDNPPPIRPFPPPIAPVDLDQYQRVVLVGDSTMEQFGFHANPKNQHSKQKYRPNIEFHGNIGRSLTLSNVAAFQNKIKESLEPLPPPPSNDTTTNSTTSSTNVALIIGSGVWDVIERDNEQGPYFLDHRAACRQLVRWIQTTYPQVQLCWKSLSAVHSHVVFRTSEGFPNYNKALKRILYMSSSRAESLVQWQKEILDELHVDCFLNVYQAYVVSADWHFPADGRHFRPELNQRVLNYFYGSENDNATIDYAYS